MRIKCQSQMELRKATASCSRARVLHVELRLTNIAALMDRLNTLALALTSRSVGDTCTWDLVTLIDAPSLHALELDLRENSIGVSGAQALAALRDARSLRTVKLDLLGNSIGDDGAQALAAMEDAP